WPANQGQRGVQQGDQVSDLIRIPIIIESSRRVFRPAVSVHFDAALDANKLGIGMTTPSRVFPAAAGLYTAMGFR
ncbi:MAG TPA: hypothetical protein PKZ39_05965, partial [Clostridia bacterium]|nr:hypothetical protein [Clostridia bacterium]